MSSKDISGLLREIRDEIASLKREVSELRQQGGRQGRGRAAAEWGWVGLEMEAMEVLCDSGRQSLSSKQITDSINARRKEGTFASRTSPASVARTLTELVKEGSVLRMQVGRERRYSLNPRKVIGIAKTGSDPISAVDELLSEVARIPEEERVKQIYAVHYTVRGLESFLLELDSRGEELAKLAGMIPKVDIRIGGTGQFWKDPKRALETTIRMFLIKRDSKTSPPQLATQPSQR